MKLRLIQIHQIIQIQVKFQAEFQANMTQVNNKLNLKENVHYVEKKYILNKIILNIIRN